MKSKINQYLAMFIWWKSKQQRIVHKICFCEKYNDKYISKLHLSDQKNRMCMQKFYVILRVKLQVFDNVLEKYIYQFINMIVKLLNLVMVK